MDNDDVVLTGSDRLGALRLMGSGPLIIAFGYVTATRTRGFRRGGRAVPLGVMLVLVGVLLLALGLVVLVRPTRLEVDRAGLRLTHLGRSVRWDFFQVGPFSVQAGRAADYVVFDSAGAKMPYYSGRAMTGRDCWLPGTLNLSARELAEMLNQRRRTALATSHTTGGERDGPERGGEPNGHA